MDLTAAAKLDRFASIDLDSLNQSAALQTRKDRKYIVPASALNAVLDELPADVRVLEIDGRRWFSYRSVYFDTPGLDSYRLAATQRPSRFKVRTRTYLDSGLAMAEVKTKSRRGRTVKNRQVLAPQMGGNDDDIRCFASQFSEVASYASDLQRTLTNQYQRATLTFAAGGIRMTIDANYQCTDSDGRTAGLDHEFIIETKTAGSPSGVDRLLWSAGHRPQKISKFATGLAALNPELPANRWNRVLRTHFLDNPNSPSPAEPLVTAPSLSASNRIERTCS